MSAYRHLSMIAGFSLLFGALGHSDEEIQGQWGEWQTRNMVSAAVRLPATIDLETEQGVRWRVPLGTQCYASPVVAGAKVFIGTNNDRPRDPRHKGDRSVLLCLNSLDGSLCWQLVVPKLTDDRYKDWPHVGICSPVTVVGERVYAVSSRGDVLCLDINGMADGNDGPFREEAVFCVPAGMDPIPPNEISADILWAFSMPDDAGTYPHDSAHTSPLVLGDFLYLNSGNGVDNTHAAIRCPDGPSLIVLDRYTGRLVCQDAEGIGPTIFHCTWSSPAFGTGAGTPLVVFGGGNGVCYAFEPFVPDPAEAGVGALRRRWRFDGDPTAPKADVNRYLGNRAESPSSINSMPVLHEKRLYLTLGGDIWWGKTQSWLKCIDPHGEGDITGTAERWSYPMSDHCSSTPAVAAGMVFVADCGKTLHCVDAQKGAALWTHDAQGEFWGSPFVADGKLYIGNRAREFLIFEASRTKKLLCAITLDSPISGTAAAADGTVYVATMKQLYAFGTD